MIAHGKLENNSVFRGDCCHDVQNLLPSSVEGQWLGRWLAAGTARSFENVGEVVQQGPCSPHSAEHSVANQTPGVRCLLPESLEAWFDRIAEIVRHDVGPGLKLTSFGHALRSLV